ncbi:helix-turn-helix domain-containing protein [Methylobacterium oryzisoli]|uniref:helix-turn-helix domain-containing protein n=1 Tax=Methylobacterium oryzisoli TaxID=3385502 RepID=UPI0038920E75
MDPQIITTEAGEELVVLSRRAYDALLARLGDEAAEDRSTARMAEAYLAAKADGGETASVPDWFVALLAEHGSPVTAARKHHGCTQAELARRLAISQGHLSDIERGRRHLTAAQRYEIAALTGIAADWLD